MAGVAHLVRAPVCGTGGSRFETGRSPHSLFDMGLNKRENFTDKNFSKTNFTELIGTKEILDKQ